MQFGTSGRTTPLATFHSSLTYSALTYSALKYIPILAFGVGIV